MEPLISVIVPVYKVERYLDKCVQSIVDQTYQNLEIILVDDGSPDSCPQKCDAWRHKDPRIHVIHKENGGISTARNCGLQVATGTYYYFVDSDDTIVPTLFERVMEIFEEHDVDIVIFDSERITEDGNKLGGTEKLEQGFIPKEKVLSELIIGNINHYMWNKVYKSDVFDQVFFPTERVCFEDMPVTCEVVLNANRIYCLNERLYMYLQRSDSATSIMTAQKLTDAYLSRMECYLAMKSSYPMIAEQILWKVCRCALRLYDRSLWEIDDPEVLEDAKAFLALHRKKIMAEYPNLWYMIFYCAPKLYDFLRISKHRIGVLLRSIR